MDVGSKARLLFQEKYLIFNLKRRQSLYRFLDNNPVTITFA
jgi:hypothetical protein